MNESIIIRSAKKEDAPDLAELAGQLGYPCKEADVRSRVERIVRNKNETILVAEDSGIVIAWTSVQIIEHFYLEPFAELSGFVVDAGRRSQGIGKALMDAAEAWVKGKGLDYLRLKTNVIRKDAHRFYERNGFTKTKEQYVYGKAIL